MVLHTAVKDILKELVLSFHYVSPRDITQIIKFEGRQLYWLNHLAGPQISSLVRHKRHK